MKCLLFFLMVCLLMPLWGQNQGAASTRVIEFKEVFQVSPKIRKPELMSTLSKKPLKIKKLERKKELVSAVEDSINGAPF